MQLILETEPTLDIRRDMSVVEGSLNEKLVANDDITDFHKKCIGNKENECNIITNDEIIASNDRTVSNLTKTLVNVKDNELAKIEMDMGCTQSDNPEETCTLHSGNSDVQIFQSHDNVDEVQNLDNFIATDNVCNEMNDSDLIENLIYEENNDSDKQESEHLKLDNESDVGDENVEDTKGDSDTVNLYKETEVKFSDLGKTLSIEQVVGMVQKQINNDNIHTKTVDLENNAIKNKQTIKEFKDYATRDSQQSTIVVQEDKIDEDNSKGLKKDSTSATLNVNNIDEGLESSLIELKYKIDTEKNTLNQDDIVNLNDGFDDSDLKFVTEESKSENINITKSDEGLNVTSIELNKIDVEEITNIQEKTESKQTVPSSPEDLEGKIYEDNLKSVTKELTFDTSNISIIDEGSVDLPTGLNNEMEVEAIANLQEKTKTEKELVLASDDSKDGTNGNDLKCVSEESKCATATIAKSNLSSKDSQTELKDEMDVEEISDVQEKIQTKDTLPFVPVDLKDATDEDNSKCLSEEVKSDIKTIDSFDKGSEDSPIELRDEVSVEKFKNIQEKTKTKQIIDQNDLMKTEMKQPSDMKDETGVDNLKCVSLESKSNNADVSVLRKSLENSLSELRDETDIEEIRNFQEETKMKETISSIPESTVSKITEKPTISKLSNTLNILSDDEDETPTKNSEIKELETHSIGLTTTEQQSINIDDDDDIMLIDEDVPTNIPDMESKKLLKSTEQTESPMKSETSTNMKTGIEYDKKIDVICINTEKESALPPEPIIDSSRSIDNKEKLIGKDIFNVEQEKPLLPEYFLKTAKKNLADMTREELEEFCILKIVESLVDRSSLSDIKAKLKAMSQSKDEYKKKIMMLTKQNRDLQVVLKSVQEEQKKKTDAPIIPLKITRSVGMQVLMTDKFNVRKKGMPQQNTPSANNVIKPSVSKNSTVPNQRAQKQTVINQNIPVPRLVPANSPAMKTPNTVPQITPIATPLKTTSPAVNGVKNVTPIPKTAEKRQHNRVQSVTVDLTDDEPPAKINPRNSPAPPVRVVSQQNLMPPQRQPFTPVVSSPRKVYIPISSPQNQAIRPGQTIIVKPVTGGRPRCTPPQVPRAQNPVRRVTSGRHPAPLPDAMKQYQPPNFKALPPAPDLRLSKVVNGIVISWKIEGYQEDSYEEIASYQLYAYQETSSPPSTTLWKKIGDVKALPLPMACTLTQFTAGFKYYFAVRAVDVKSRLGPFSLPASILLLNKS